MREEIDEYGKWIIYDSGFRALIEPSQLWIDENPPVSMDPIEDEPSEIEILQDKVRVLEAKNAALEETTAFYEECLVEMAEIVYA